jgi:hypothetical protein
LDDLVTLIVKDPMSFLYFKKVSLPNSQKWPLLRRVRLTHDVSNFLYWLEDDKGGCENPLLPSLRELVLVDYSLSKHETYHLHSALMKRVEQEVPLEMLDLRTCDPDSDFAAVQLLSEIVEDVLGPEEADDARSQIISTWDGLTCGPFVGHANSDNDNSDTSSDEDDEE